jgi:hypothetical protein
VAPFDADRLLGGQLHGIERALQLRSAVFDRLAGLSRDELRKIFGIALDKGSRAAQERCALVRCNRCSLRARPGCRLDSNRDFRG